MEGPVLCVCNYGLVRSRTMAHRLKARGIEATAAGFLNVPAHIMDVLMTRYNTVLICNKPNVEERFCLEEGMTDEIAGIILGVLEKHQKKGKVIICDVIGRDKWAKVDHPELVGICDAYLDNIMG